MGPALEMENLWKNVLDVRYSTVERICARAWWVLALHTDITDTGTFHYVLIHPIYIHIENCISIVRTHRSRVVEERMKANMHMSNIKMFTSYSLIE